MVALALTMAARRWWTALASFALAFCVPALWWWLRAREGPSYVMEFWLVDPYRPDLGGANAADLAVRAFQNVRTYVGRWVPGGLIGLRGGLVSGVGVAMFVLAGSGWWRRVRSGWGLAEVFAPLYLGLILLWPVVWAGDRFALPLYALVLFYAGETIAEFTREQPRRLRVAAAVVACLPLLIPAAALWSTGWRQAGACRELIEANGAFACYDDTVREYVKAAEWSREHLPGDRGRFGLFFPAHSRP